MTTTQHRRSKPAIQPLFHAMLLGGGLSLLAAPLQAQQPTASTASSPAVAVADPAANKEVTAENAIEVIEISGYRGSLNVALLSKRQAVGAKETILAEDLGKFPDLNIADSLSRIPGVAIEQDAGEGRQNQLTWFRRNFCQNYH